MKTSNKNRILKAGAVKVNITPYIGAPLNGFGSRKKGSTGILDDLYCRAVVFSDGDKTSGIVVCDLLTLQAETVKRIREMVSSQRKDLDGENILIAATHTHSGPMTQNLRLWGEIDECLNRVYEKCIAGAIINAYDNMTEVTLSIGKGHTAIGANRRIKDPETGKVSPIIAPNFDVPIDTDVLVASFDNLDGKNLAILVNHCCHPVVFGGDNFLISRDYPGYTVDTLEREIGSGVSIFVQGACGNIDPIKRGSVEAAASTGTQLANEALRVIRDGLVRVENPKINQVKETCKVSLGDIPSKEELEKILESDTWYFMKPWAKDALDTYSRGTRPYTVDAEIQVISVGDMAIVGIPGELFNEIGTEIKNASPFKMTFVSGYANGCIGYIPTHEAYSEGGYEVDLSYILFGIFPLTDRVESEVLDTVRKLYNSLDKE